MLHSRNLVRLIAAGVLLTFAATDAAALPTIPRPPFPGGVGKPQIKQPRGGNRNRGKQPKPVDPLITATNSLKDAEKNLESKDGSARKHADVAEQIVSGQLQGARQARDRAAGNSNVPKEEREKLKTRIAALDAIVKDIKTVEKGIAARKPDEAKTAIAAAIDKLEELTGVGDERRKRKKN